MPDPLRQEDIGAGIASAKPCGLPGCTCREDQTAPKWIHCPRHLGGGIHVVYHEGTLFLVCPSCSTQGEPFLSVAVAKRERLDA